MTQKEYIAQALEETSHTLMAQGVDLFEATVEQAWYAFVSFLAVHPLSLLTQEYLVHGIGYSNRFVQMWPLFQQQLYENCQQVEVIQR